MLSPPYNKAWASVLHQKKEINKATARRRQLLRQRCFPDSSVISWEHPKLTSRSLVSLKTDSHLKGLNEAWKDWHPCGAGRRIQMDFDFATATDL